MLHGKATSDPNTRTLSGARGRNTKAIPCRISSGLPFFTLTLR